MKGYSPLIIHTVYLSHLFALGSLSGTIGSYREMTANNEWWPFLMTYTIGVPNMDDISSLVAAHFKIKTSLEKLDKAYNTPELVKTLNIRVKVGDEDVPEEIVHASIMTFIQARLRLEEKAQEVKGKLMETLDELGVENIKTEAGTVYFTHPENYSVSDPESFVAWVVDRGAYEILPKTLARKEAVRAACGEGEVPEGVEVTRIRNLNVRKAS